MSSAIPADIQKAAAAVYARLGRGADADEQAIAAALMAERQQSSLVAQCHSDDRPRRDGIDWNDGYVDGCRGAAAAILNPASRTGA